jgi:hypothetical protein
VADSALLTISNAEFLGSDTLVLHLQDGRAIQCVIEPDQLYEMAVEALKNLPDHMRELAIEVAQKR